MKSLSEKQIMRHFNNFKRRYIKILGDKALYADEINSFCLIKFHPWRGCNPQDKVVLKQGYQIINVDNSNQKGSHWIAIYITPKTCYIYDSFGRPSKKLLIYLTKKLKTHKMKWKDSDNDAEQFGNSEICGQLCISWLSCIQKFGLMNALKI